jgi:hypothetical protein
MCRVKEDVFATEIKVQIKPLEWISNCGRDYRLFEADTEFGRFSYGTDRQSASYYQTPTDEIDHWTEEGAKAAAEQTYGQLVLEKIRKLTVPAPAGVSETKSFSVLIELRSLLLKYAEDCVEARSYGGPTIYPSMPFDEGLARKYAIKLKELERLLGSQS